MNCVSAVLYRYLEVTSNPEQLDDGQPWVRQKREGIQLTQGRAAACTNMQRAETGGKTYADREWLMRRDSEWRLRAGRAEERDCGDFCVRQREQIKGKKDHASQAGWQPVHRETYRSGEVKARKHRSLFLTPKKRKTRSGLGTSPPKSWPCGRDEGIGKQWVRLPILLVKLEARSSARQES